MCLIAIFSDKIAEKSKKGIGYKIIRKITYKDGSVSYESEIYIDPITFGVWKTNTKQDMIRSAESGFSGSSGKYYLNGYHIYVSIDEVQKYLEIHYPLGIKRSKMLFSNIPDNYNMRNFLMTELIVVRVQYDDAHTLGLDACNMTTIVANKIYYEVDISIKMHVKI